MAKRVVLEGCLGHWSKKSYVEFLRKKADENKIKLFAVDIRDRRDDEIGLFEDKEFVNKKADQVMYNEIKDVDFVFIVAPHEFHFDIAEHWLGGKLKENGKIFIEKPLDSSVARIEKLQKKYGKKINERILAVDHYIPKIDALLEKLRSSEDKKESECKYGKIKKIRFNLLESDPIPQSRENTLREGVILDMFPHVLAVFTKIMKVYCNKDFTLNVNNLQVIEVKTGKYECSKIEGETFAKIVIKTNDIILESCIGKAVGSHDNKKLEIFLEKEIKQEEPILEKYFVIADFVSGNFFIKNEDGKILGKGALPKEPIKILLNEILGRNISNPDRYFLSFSEGYEIVKIISKIREKVCRKIGHEKIEYEKSELPNRILMKFVNLTGRDKKSIDVLLNQYNCLREEIVRCIYLEHLAIIGLYTSLGVVIASLVGKIVEYGIVKNNANNPITSFADFTENLELGELILFLLLLILAQIYVNGFGSLFLKEQARNRRVCSFLRGLEHIINEKIGEIGIYWENFIVSPLIDKKIAKRDYFGFKIPVNPQYYKNRLLGVGIPVYLPNLLITSLIAFLLFNSYGKGYLFSMILILCIILLPCIVVLCLNAKKPILTKYIVIAAVIIFAAATAVITFIFSFFTGNLSIYLLFLAISSAMTILWASMIFSEVSLPLKGEVAPSREEVLNWLEDENLALLWR